MWIAQRHSSEGDYRRVLNERENDLLALNEASGPRSNAHMAALREAHDVLPESRHNGFARAESGDGKLKRFVAPRSLRAPARSTR